MSDILYCIWELFNQKHEVINAIVLFITLLVIIWYTIETMKMRRSNENTLNVLKETLNLEKQKNEPNVIAYFDNGANLYSIVLVISNEGGSTAKHVKITFEPELNFGDSKFIEFFNNNAVSKNGIDIQSRSKYVLRVGHTPTASPLYKENKIPTSYKSIITYKNPKSENDQITKSFDLTIDQFFYRLDPEGKEPIEKQLVEVNKNLISIADSIANKKNSNDTNVKT